MRLHLPFEAPWVVKEGPSDQRVAVLPGTGSELPASIVTYGRIALKPDEPRRWIERVVHSDIPAGTKVEVGRILDNTTVDGWSMRLVESLVTKPNGDVVEARLTALYTFMEHAAEAIVRAPDRAGMDRVGGTVLAVLSRGRPDWRGEPAWLADV